MNVCLALPLLLFRPWGVVYNIKQYCKSIKGVDIERNLNSTLWTKTNWRKVMWAFLVARLLLFMLFYTHLSSAGSSSLYSSCRLQGKFQLNGMHKDGDVILGGLFQIHFFSTYPDLSFNSEPQHPTCHGWVCQGRSNALISIILMKL